MTDDAEKRTAEEEKAWEHVEESVTEADCIAADEARDKERRRLTESFHLPSVTLRLSLRGERNRGGLADLAFRRGLDWLFELTGVPVFWEKKEEKTGCEAILVCDTPAEELAALCRELTAGEPAASIYVTEVCDDAGTLVERRGRSLEDSGAARQILGEEAARFLGDGAVKSLVFAARFTPKPGLVDSRSNGIYSDRDLAKTERSAEALRPFLEEAARVGMSGDVSVETLRRLGEEGIRAAAEAADGADIHSSALTLFLPALAGMGASLVGGGLASEIGAVLAKEMGPIPGRDRRKIRSLYEKYGTRGIIEQAERGFPAARQAEAMLLRNGTDLLTPYLEICAGTADPFLLLRGGLEGQMFVRSEVKKILEAPEAMRLRMAVKLDEALILRGYAPEEAPDHLALALLIRQMDGVGFDF